MRRYAIGDIHGCAKALRGLIEAIAPQATDELVFLGDYIDRGPDSRDVIEQVIDLRSRCRVVALRGNHEIMLAGVVFRKLNPEVWLGSGGHATVTSYGGDIRKIPQHHRAFLKSLRPYYESQDTIFVHAAYEPHLPMDRQADAIMYWAHLGMLLPAPHISGKRVIVGHTPQPDGRVMDAGHLVCVDTHCFGNGYLTAYDIDTNDAIQVNRQGHLLRSPAKALLQKVTRLLRGKPARWAPAQQQVDHPPLPGSEPSAQPGSGIHG